MSGRKKFYVIVVYELNSERTTPGAAEMLRATLRIKKGINIQDYYPSSMFLFSGLFDGQEEAFRRAEALFTKYVNLTKKENAVKISVKRVLLAEASEAHMIVGY